MSDIIGNEQQVPTPFWKSKTFYGIVLTLVLPIVKSKLHFSNIDTDSLADVLANVATGLSAIWAIYGRAKATGPLTVTNIANTPVTPKE